MKDDRFECRPTLMSAPAPARGSDKSNTNLYNVLIDGIRTANAENAENVENVENAVFGRNDTET